MDILGISLSVIGLVILCIGWVLQLMKSWKGEKEIQKGFVAVYAIGALVLVIDGYTSGLTSLAALNALTVILSALVFYKIK